MFKQSGRGAAASWASLHVRVVRHCWVPAADVYETPTGWIVKLELAGVRREDVAVTLEGNSIRVRGSRQDRVSGSVRCHSLEIPYERFERKIELARQAVSSRMTTEYRDGMLLVTVDTQESEP